MLSDLDRDSRLRTEKADFTDIYTRPDPRPYYRTLAGLDYQVAHRALPVVESVLEAARCNGSVPTVLDVCCSYGILSALLRHPDGPGRVVARYTSPRLEGLTTEQLALADRRRYARPRREVAVLGLDLSRPAIEYGVRAGLLADAWAADLESADPPPGMVEAIRAVRVVTCTGGYGYVGPATFERLLRAMPHPDSTWFVVTALRAFDYRPMTALLASYGLATRRLPVPLRQRRFASRQEQLAAVHDLRRRGVDPAGHEAEGWLYADCYVSRPRRAV